jgi:hypothetical protein
MCEGAMRGLWVARKGQPALLLPAVHTCPPPPPTLRAGGVPLLFPGAEVCVSVIGMFEGGGGGSPFCVGRGEGGVLRAFRKPFCLQDFLLGSSLPFALPSRTPLPPLHPGPFPLYFHSCVSTISKATLADHMKVCKARPKDVVPARYGCAWAPRCPAPLSLSRHALSTVPHDRVYRISNSARDEQGSRGPVVGCACSRVDVRGVPGSGITGRGICVSVFLQRDTWHACAYGVSLGL